MSRVSSVAILTTASPLVAQGCFFAAPECELCGDPGSDVCIPAEGLGPPPDECGTFVSPSLGDDDAEGSKDQPLRTLGEALERASNGGRVYACGERFDEKVVVPPGVHLFGALDCQSGFWYAPETVRTEIFAPPGEVAIELSPGTAETRIVDVRAVAAAGSAPGTSSIAALAHGATAVFVRTTLVAGDAQAGADGEPFDTAAEGGVDGTNGCDACVDFMAEGAAAPVVTCAGGISAGGRGGDGGPYLGGDGGNGLPADISNHGKGQPESSAAECTDGGDGLSAEDGAPGAGGDAPGRIGPSGYAGVPGTEGVAGAIAQGGGGGGGAKGGGPPWGCGQGLPTGGASGGSGGSGGCGGRGGRGGQAGGSSIAIVSVDSQLAFEDSTLVAGRGGDGGNGGPGQSGGVGGKGAKGGAPSGSLDAACQGGHGGTGGNGGRGGGGAAGHSLGVAYLGVPVANAGADVSVAAPGIGGMGGGDAGRGRDGLAAATLEFKP